MMFVFRFLFFGYLVGVLAGLFVGAYAGLAAGLATAWIGGGAFSLLFALAWHLRTRGTQRRAETDSSDGAERAPNSSAHASAVPGRR